MKSRSLERKWHTFVDNVAHSERRGMNHDGQMPTRTASARPFRAGAASGSRSARHPDRGLLSDHRPSSTARYGIPVRGWKRFLPRRKARPRIRGAIALRRRKDIRSPVTIGTDDCPLPRKLSSNPSRPCVLLHAELEAASLKRLKDLPSLRAASRRRRGQTTTLLSSRFRDANCSSPRKRTAGSRLAFPAVFRGFPAVMSEAVMATPISRNTIRWSLSSTKPATETWP